MTPAPWRRSIESNWSKKDDSPRGPHTITVSFPIDLRFLNTAALLGLTYDNTDQPHMFDATGHERQEDDND